MNSLAENVSLGELALAQRGWSILEARQHVGPIPGLYAIHAGAEAWEQIGIDRVPGVPLYVGKSERELGDPRT